MWLSDDARLPRSDDAARLTEFGAPVFGFVPQPRLRERGWSWFAQDGQTLETQAHYWLAETNGDFGFTDSPAGLVGTELRGFVFTDVIGSTGRRDEPIHAALVQHLDYVVSNFQKSRYEPGTPQWIDHGQSRRAAIETAEVSPATLTLVDVSATDPAEQNRSVNAMSASAAVFSATTAAIDGRIVTVVVHHADREQIDIRLVRRV